MSKSSKEPSKSALPIPEGTEAHDFYLELGRALSAWNSVEEAISDIFGLATNVDDPDAALAAFWSVVSFEAKIALANGAVQACLTNEVDLSRIWLGLKVKLKNKVVIRNNLAHGTVLTQTWKVAGQLRQETCLAIYYNRNRHLDHVSGTKSSVDPRPKLRKSLDAVIKDRDDFRELMIHLWEFSEQFYERLMQRERLSQGITVRLRPARIVLPKPRIQKDT